MTPTTGEIRLAKAQYEVEIWDYDAAPDGAGYHVRRRYKTEGSKEAIEAAHRATHEESMLHAVVYKDGEIIREFTYREDDDFYEIVD